MEKVATDIYTFSRLREYGFTYVDKTDALSASTTALHAVSLLISP